MSCRRRSHYVMVLTTSYFSGNTLLNISLIVTYEHISYQKLSNLEKNVVWCIWWTVFWCNTTYRLVSKFDLYPFCSLLTYTQLSKQDKRHFKTSLYLEHSMPILQSFHSSCKIWYRWFSIKTAHMHPELFSSHPKLSIFIGIISDSILTNFYFGNFKINFNLWI